MEQWIRKVTLDAGGRQFDGEDFTIYFSVPFSSETPEPDISEIEIYNLSDSTINSIEKEAYAILNAGYQGDYGNILSGKIDKVETEWQGLDKITKIQISDGGKEWRKTTTHKTFKAGTKADYIMRELGVDLGLEIIEITPANNIEYKLGKTISGSTEAALRQLAKDTNSKMYITNEKLVIRPTDKGTETPFILSSETGLIDSPTKVEEEDDKGNKKISYDVKCLLNYHINKDSIIRIQSRTINGRFRVTKGRHDGKTFYTEMNVVPV